MFGIGSFELLFILLLGLLIFGPEKLSKIARTFGRWLVTFRGTVADVQTGISQELKSDEKKDDVS